MRLQLFREAPNVGISIHRKYTFAVGNFVTVLIVHCLLAFLLFTWLLAVIRRRAHRDVTAVNRPPLAGGNTLNNKNSFVGVLGHAHARPPLPVEQRYL